MFYSKNWKTKSITGRFWLQSECFFDKEIIKREEINVNYRLPRFRLNQRVWIALQPECFFLYNDFIATKYSFFLQKFLYNSFFFFNLNIVFFSIEIRICNSNEIFTLPKKVPIQSKCAFALKMYNSSKTFCNENNHNNYEYKIMAIPIQ